MTHYQAQQLMEKFIQEFGYLCLKHKVDLGSRCVASHEMEPEESEQYATVTLDGYTWEIHATADGNVGLIPR